MPCVRRGNVGIDYEVHGVGPPLLLLHSFLCNRQMWAPQVGVLATRYRVINVDLRGHGKSTLPDRPFDLYDLVDDLLAVLDQERIGQAVWAGLSIGGMLAMRAALVAGERVSGLILLDTDAGAETAWNRLRYQLMAGAARILGTAPLVPQVIRMFFCARTRRTRPDLVRQWREEIASVPLVTIRRTVAALRHRDAVLTSLPSIRQPALVLVGAEDRPLPPTRSKALAAALPAAALQVIEHAGHLSALEQPNAVTAAMLAFLDRLPARAGREEGF